MSVEAITWALKQQVSNSSTKFVLVVLANCASGDTFRAWPSIAYLCDATSQNRKTVIANFQRLIEQGLIRDTGGRAGESARIPIYALAVAGNFGNGAENGTVPKTAADSPKNGTSQSRKRDTDTLEPSGNSNVGRGGRLADGWQPSDELIAWAVTERGLKIAWVDEQTAAFRDHWKAATGAKATKLDWDATWRNWIRNAEKWNGRSGSRQGGKSAVERVRENNAAAESAGR